MTETSGKAKAPNAETQVGTTPAVSILIVAYNSADLIEGCVGSIAPACLNQHYEVLLVDNGDGSTEALVAAKFPDVQIVPSKGNVGFAGGNNWLAQHARAERLLLLNPDMVLEPGAIDALIAGAQRHPEAAAWGGVTVNANGDPDSGNAIAMPSLIEFASVALGRSLIAQREIPGLDKDARVEVLTGGFVMLAREAWENVGGLDERFFLYSEEVDLFYRLSKAGYSHWRIADARGFHEVAHGVSFSPTRLMYRAAGTMEFVRRHWSAPAAALAFALNWIAALERYGAGRLLGWWKPRLKKMADGYRNVALRPHFWMHGYDKKRGLMAKLNLPSDQNSD